MFWGIEGALKNKNSDGLLIYESVDWEWVICQSGLGNMLWDDYTL
jgi:hypothetical protein